MAVFFVWLAGDAPAQEDEGLTEKIGQGFDAAIGQIRGWIDKFNQQAGKVLPPPLSYPDEPGDALSGLKTQTRTENQIRPVPSAPLISIESEFGDGEVRVTTWDQQVVRVQAEITAGAESAAAALEAANAIQVRVTEHEEGLDIRPEYPEGSRFRISFDVTIPRDARLNCTNFFGDTIVAGTGGEVAIRSTNGRIELRDLAKPVHVWSRGAAPLFAYGLREGGDFVLHDTQAEFVNVAGTLKVGIFMGSVKLRELAPACEIDVGSVYGPVDLFLRQTDTPNVDATALHGEVTADREVQQVFRPSLTRARMLNPASTQTVRLSATFANVAIHTEGMPAAPAGLPPVQTGELSNELLADRTYPAPEGTKLYVDAIVGDVRIEGVDESALTIGGTKRVRVEPASNAPAALEALVVRMDASGGAIRVTSALAKDLATLGCRSYRVDLTVRCPRNVPVEVRAQNGNTTIVGMAAPVKVEQAEGEVLAQQAAGSLDLRNNKGNITARDCSGAITMTGASGTAKTLNAQGPQNITWQQGKVVVDAPLNEVTARNTGGDISIIALSGIAGDYDVNVEKGDLSLMMLDNSDATLFITTRNGRVDVHNGLSLAGRIEKGVQMFQQSLNNGKYRVALTAQDGNIAID